MSHRHYALNLLSMLEDALRRDRPIPDEARHYLLAVCERVRVGSPDPLGIKRTPGRQSEPSFQREVACMVHKRIAAGSSLADAVYEVGQATGKSGGSGEAVEKAYRQHRSEIEAVEKVHAGTVTAADWAALGTVFRKNAERNRRK